jgi:hypothetical protein
LVQDVPTRWSSTYDMLQSIFENRIPIVSALMFSKHADLLPNPSEWTIIESLIAFLYPFKVGTNFFQTEQQVSISAIYPFLQRLKKNHTIELDSDPAIIRNMKKSMAVTLQHIINEYKGDLILAATILDPR